jgi:hypothetical protein
MSEWQITVLGGFAGVAVWCLYAIFVEVRSIRRMMNAERRISNEVKSYDD